MVDYLGVTVTVLALSTDPQSWSMVRWVIGADVADSCADGSLVGNSKKYSIAMFVLGLQAAI